MTSKFIGVFMSLAVASILWLTGCGNDSSVQFKSTDAGNAVYKCVSGSGNLAVNSVELKDGRKGVTVLLSKNSKEISMLFAVDPSINQAKLVSADIKGEQSINKFTLMLYLEMACGGELAAVILPDEYRSLQMLNMLR